MATVQPFKGYRYNLKKPGDAASVVAPPYDVIDEDGRAALRAQDSHNVVRLILPEQGDVMDAKDKYEAAAKTFEKWLAEDVIVQEDAPALYRYRQEFELPGAGRTSREGIIAQVRLHRFEEGVILPHEKTLEGPKADRLALTKATKKNLSPTFSFFFDPKKAVTGAIGDPGQAWIDFVDGDGVRQQVWRITDPKIHQAVEKAFKDLKLYIADGHHRYTTAIHYRDLVRKCRGKTDPEHPAEFNMMFVADASEMTVLPYHRMLLASAGKNARNRIDELIGELAELFDIQEFDTSNENGNNAFVTALQGSEDAYAFGVVVPSRTFLLRDKSGEKVRATFRKDLPPSLRELDVAALHELILGDKFGISAEQIAQGGIMKYSPDATKVFRFVDSGEADVGFLVRPTKLEQVRAVAEAGEVMPQKSTYFYPKLASGLVFRSVSDEDA